MSLTPRSFLLTLAVGLLALMSPSCGPSEPKDRIVGVWEAIDGSGFALHFDRDGKMAYEIQGKVLETKGDYKFVNARRVEVTGKNFLVTLNERPLPMGFDVDFDKDGRSITITPGPERELMMQVALFGNGKFHTFPPVKDPTRYTRRG